MIKLLYLKNGKTINKNLLSNFLINITKTNNKKTNNHIFKKLIKIFKVKFI